MSVTSVRYSYRLRVSAAAQRYLLREYGMCRWLWNQLVAESRRRYRQNPDAAFGYAAQDKFLTALALGRFVASRDWEAREQVSVEFRTDGAVHRAQRCTPADQNALEGRFVSAENASGPGNTKQILAWLGSAPYRPN